MEESQFQSPLQECTNTHHNCADIVLQFLAQKKSQNAKPPCLLPQSEFFRLLCILKIENGTERWSVQKYFADPDVCDGKIPKVVWRLSSLHRPYLFDKNR